MSERRELVVIDLADLRTIVREAVREALDRPSPRRRRATAGAAEVNETDRQAARNAACRLGLVVKG